MHSSESEICTQILYSNEPDHRNESFFLIELSTNPWIEACFPLTDVTRGLSSSCPILRILPSKPPSKVGLPGV